MFRFKSANGHGIVEIIHPADEDAVRVTNINIRNGEDGKFIVMKLQLSYRPHERVGAFSDDEIAKIAIAQFDATYPDDGSTHDLDFAVMPWSGELKK